MNMGEGFRAVRRYQTYVVRFFAMRNLPGAMG
jgi:hypothetical protein